MGVEGGHTRKQGGPREVTSTYASLVHFPRARSASKVERWKIDGTLDEEILATANSPTLQLSSHNHLFLRNHINITMEIPSMMPITMKYP